ncbi:hypothetical protein [Streptomyces acidiscabies]|uniref:hypothetical protein n=1 Tax=Streptomyces acidiscabies TaxID=42234 RepID=UPI0015BE141B|nr:hypothetical protein [Streptomyces acidiscabies]
MIALLPQRAGELRLDEVIFSAEIIATGTVSPLGSGAGPVGEARITFAFSRAELARHLTEWQYTALLGGRSCGRQRTGSRSGPGGGSRTGPHARRPRGASPSGPW